MHKFGGTLLVAALLLSGCAATPSTPAPAVTSASPAPEMTAEQVATIPDAATFVRSLSASTPDLAGEMSAVARKMSDLAPASDLPWGVRNKVGQDLAKVNAQILNDPTSAATQLGELNRIVDEIEDAL